VSEADQIAIMSLQLKDSLQKIAYLKEELAVLKKLIFSSKSERYKSELDINQHKLHLPK